MRAGVEPERVVAGSLLVIVAALAAGLGSAVVLGPLLFAGLRDSQDLNLPLGLAAVGLAAALTWLSMVVLVGRRPQRALVLASAAMLAVAVGTALAGAPHKVTGLLVVVALASVAAALVGAARDDGRTRGWWATRALLIVGIAAVLCALAAVVFAARDSGTMGGTQGEPILGVPREVLIFTVGLGGALAGLAWMVRIMRGPRDEPPPWRYRDR